MVLSAHFKVLAQSRHHLQLPDDQQIVRYAHFTV